MKENTPPPLVSVVLRAHDPSKAWLLREAITSVLAQTYKNVEMILTLQNYSEADVAALKADLDSLLLSAPMSYQLLPISADGFRDRRAYALNVGVRAARGTRIGFLDYDDVLYPEAYFQLNKALDESGAGCAVGACDLAYAERNDSIQEFNILRIEKFFWDCPSVERLKHNSFTPIHSLLIDKSRVREVERVLVFPEDMSIFEDYACFLSLIPQTSFDFSSFSKAPVCQYRVPAVGGQSIITLQNENYSLYKEHRKKIWKLRSRLGFVNVFFLLVHPFYYPFKTKLHRLKNRLLGMAL